MRLRASTIRRGFTLIELLVVLGIIALLATLTAAAVMRYQQGQRETNTNTHLRKIHMELEKQWTAKVALIKSEPIPQVLREYTKNADGSYDNARAKALHLKLRLRQEFPQNFGEVMSTVTLETRDATNTVTLAQYVYGSKPAFKTAIKNPTMVESPLEAQSAAMLVLILSQGGGGSTTDVDAIARTKTLDYPQQGGGTISLKVFADEWDNHIAFRRLADDDMTDVIAELNRPPFAPGSGNTDPQDPDGRLKMNANAWAIVQTKTGPQNGKVACTAFLAYPTPGSRPYIVDPFDGLNRGPFAVSAGKNGRFIDASGKWETDLDNLYSFRVAQSGKGN